MRLALGHYTVNETITPTYTRLLQVSPADATATVKMTVVKPSAGGGLAPRAGHQPQSRPLRSAPAVPAMANPPASALPDLVPLPSWGISVAHVKKTKTHPASDQLDFGATVSVGHAPLDVEGFRSHGSPIMKAYQYFWQNGHTIGRVRAGTMGFDSKKGHNHWHFEQFAQYRLLNSGQRLPCGATRWASASPRPTRSTCCSQERYGSRPSWGSAASAVRRPPSGCRN